MRHFELSNESWKTNQAAQYAWALLDWAPALRAAHPGALIGANGPAGKTEVGDRDSGVAWWPQVTNACHPKCSPGSRLGPVRHAGQALKTRSCTVLPVNHRMQGRCIEKTANAESVQVLLL